MRKFLLFFPVFLLLLTGWLSAQKIDINAIIEDGAWIVGEAVPQGTVVAVLNFDSTSYVFSEYVIAELTEKLTIGRKVNVIDRQNLLPVSKEMNLQLSGNVSDQSAQAIGQLLGAQSIVSGSLTNMGSFHRFRIRVIHVENAAIQAQIFLDLYNVQVN